MGGTDWAFVENNRRYFRICLTAFSIMVIGSKEGIMRIVDSQDTIRQYAGPGHWNDPDMLEVGNGIDEWRRTGRILQSCACWRPH